MRLEVVVKIPNKKIYYYHYRPYRLYKTSEYGRAQKKLMKLQFILQYAKKTFYIFDKKDCILSQLLSHEFSWEGD